MIKSYLVTPLYHSTLGKFGEDGTVVGSTLTSNGKKEFELCEDVNDLLLFYGSKCRIFEVDSYPESTREFGSLLFSKKINVLREVDYTNLVTSDNWWLREVAANNGYGLQNIMEKDYRICNQIT